MDPLSALGVAGNIVQFVEFACKLISSTQKIYRSSSTTSESSSYIDGIHERLVSFEAQLSRQGTTRSQVTPTRLVSAHSDALDDLLKKCKQECIVLLGLTSKIKAKTNTGGRLWASFRKAILEVWHDDEISKLQSRLQEYQTEIIVRLCAISRENTEETAQNVQHLLSDISLQRNERLTQFTELENSLKDLISNVQLIATRVCKPNGKGIVRSCTDDEICVLTERVSQLVLIERSISREEAILRRLDYVQRPVRYETIPEAHKRTFSWVFDRGPKSRGFAEWLETGKGIYWITGKPGSGKSTLMKYILQSPRTVRRLSAWSTSTPLVVASHFFWSAGLPIQRSLEGLLRSLLYDIFSRLPELISKIYAENPEIFDQRGRTTQSWSLTWLEDLLRQLTARKELPMRFCFFIDGLDEFEGDKFKICSTLDELCSSADIKMCVASRPWNVFETCIGESAAHRLPVHELTHDDIRNYADSELRGHPKWNTSVTCGVGVPNLVGEITDRAEGVFLWVFLVTRMLREGLMNDDSLTELRTRLDSVPTDLGKFFKHILDSVDPFYHEKQSGTLQVALAADEPLHPHLYSFHDLEYTYENYAINHDRRLLNQHELSRFYSPFPRRLNGRCKGLLEIRKQRVEFLHRTVRDFFHTGEMTEYLQSKTKSSFNPCLSILRAHVAWIKTRLSVGDFQNDNTHGLCFISTLRRTLDYTQATIEQNEPCQILCSELLDDLELSVEALILTQGSCIMPGNSEESDPIETANEFRLLFRHAVIEKQLAHFVSTKMENDLDYFGDLEQGPLLPALRSYSTNRDAYSVLAQPNGDNRSSLPKSTKLLQILLENNWNPNEVSINPANGLTTPWSEFMSCMVPWHSSSDLSRDLDKDTQECFIHALTSGVFHMLLRHKADPNSRIPNWQRENEDDYCPTIGTIFILLGLKVEDVWKYRETYLRDLKMMIHAGADFGDLNLGGTFKIEETTSALSVTTDESLVPGRKQWPPSVWETMLKVRDRDIEIIRDRAFEKFWLKYEQEQEIMEQHQDLELETRPTEHEQDEESSSTRKELQQPSDIELAKRELRRQKNLEELKSSPNAIGIEKREGFGKPQEMQTRWGLICALLEPGCVPGRRLFQAYLIAELAKADLKNTLNWRALEPIIRGRFPKGIGQIMLRAIHGKQSTSC
ncbi:hypothetical protein NUW58_g812 [Xylaria curta]|uniref:Uncharacterized protein n=1 Tax=Xylaria curta TaxID=42375 RepID=A0ACC1PMU0_9PEZI|nr:hypothetical protein NUW58_g812 [Xylaria curta]